MRLFDMMTREDIKRLNDSTIEGLELENKKLKKKVEEAEEALTKALAGDHRVAESDKIIMKKITEIEELKADLARAKEDHQYDNLVHQNEVKKLLEKF